MRAHPRKTALKEEPAITKPADQSKLKHEENSKQPMNMTTKQTATTKANSAKEKKGRVRETSPITR